MKALKSKNGGIHFHWVLEILGSWLSPKRELGKQMMGLVSKAILIQTMFAREWSLPKQRALSIPHLQYPPTCTKSSQIQQSNICTIQYTNVSNYSHKYHPLQELWRVGLELSNPISRDNAGIHIDQWELEIIVETETNHINYYKEND